MATVYGIHEFELRPECDEEAFVRFFNQEIIPFVDEEDWHLVLLKGDRGKRNGKYALMFYGSKEKRDAGTPEPDTPSEESKLWMEAHKEEIDRLLETWASFSPDQFGGDPYTDYVEVK